MSKNESGQAVCDTTGKPLSECGNKFQVIGKTYVSPYTGLGSGQKRCTECRKVCFYSGDKSGGGK